MSVPYWDEYTRVQHLVEIGKARDEQLDALLKRYTTDGHPFNLHDCRRRLKNLGRNLPRNDRRRSFLLKQFASRLDSRSSEGSLATVIRHESAATMRHVAGNDWEFLRETIDGNYTEIAAASGVAVGTIKSRVSRARVALRTLLREQV